MNTKQIESPQSFKPLDELSPEERKAFAAGMKYMAFLVASGWQFYRLLKSLALVGQPLHALQTAQRGRAS
jgi:hypothetical protein